MTAVTTMIPPPVLRYLFRNDIPPHPAPIRESEERVQIG
jgi:hypothetical protein